MTTRLLALSSIAFAGLLGPACSGGAPAPGARFACGGEERVALDCASEVAYQGTKTGGSIGIASFGGGSASYEDRAIRKVNDELARYVAVQTRLCRDYNACVLGREQYNAEAKRTREMFEQANAYSSATTDVQKRVALGRIYDAVVPEEQRGEQLAVALAIEAELPAGAGGGRVTLKPGEPLPSGARVSFRLRSTKPAHLYLFQKKPSGELSVLFPDARIGVTNPVSAAAPVEIPGGGRRFKVDDKELGLENVYLVASRSPLPSVDRALRKIADAGAPTVAAAPELRPVVAIGAGDGAGCRSRALELEAGAPSGCVRSRGLSLDDDGASDAAGSSLSVRTEAGDDTIAVAFPFEHVTESAYPEARRRFGGR